MGAARKLQAEIDRTLKKVQEGIVEFDQIWIKVYDTESQSQREKYEGDLKKEIKKLQRLRDQIKTWIAGSDIKDKSVLMEARKNIEKEMERFKLCEKEAKTKAFSKAGLGQAAKLDPEEKKRQEAREWLNEQVEALQMQIDEFEAKLEGIISSKRGKKPQQRQQTLEEIVVRHKNHIARLEQCMRCLDNGTVTHDDTEELKDSVEYYVQECEEENAGFESVDDTYAALLDRLNDVTLGLQPPNVSAKVKKTNDMEDEQAEREREKERAAAAAVKAQLLSSHGSNVSTLLEEEKKATGTGRGVPITANATQSKRRLSMSEIPTGNHLSEDLDDPPSPTKSGNALGTSLSNAVTNGSLTFASAAAGRTPVTTVATPPTTTPTPTTTTPPQLVSLQPLWDSQKIEEVSEFPKLVLSEKAKSMDLSVETKQKKRLVFCADPVLLQTKVDPATVFPPVGSSDYPQGNHPSNAAGSSLHDAPRVNNIHVNENTMGFMAAVVGSSSSSLPPDPASANPLLSVKKVEELIDELVMSCTGVTASPLAPGQFEENPAASLQLLQACSRRSMPQPADRDYRPHLAQNTARTVSQQQLPASFPIHRLPQLEDPSFYQKLNEEGLFYAFHFLPGDIAQYCAAKELKRQLWRYHVQHQAWFLRSGEPKASTTEFEEGSYHYFDSSISLSASNPLSSAGETENAMNGWSYRMKDNFVFRYDQLEDELH